MSYFTQLNPSIPMRHIDKGSAEAIGVLDYGVEHHLLWVCILDSDGSIWSWPNTEVRGIENVSIGRKLSVIDKKGS